MINPTPFSFSAPVGEFLTKDATITPDGSAFFPVRADRSIIRSVRMEVWGRIPFLAFQLEFQLQVQHCQPRWARVLPCIRTRTDA